jgi:hypothetical protein
VRERGAGLSFERAELVRRAGQMRGGEAAVRALLRTRVDAQ